MALDVLFIGDTNLGKKGMTILDKHLYKYTHIIWNVNDSKKDSSIRKAKKIIHSKVWDICISFYSDLVLDAKDLACFQLPLNIHPSLPLLRGVGYDTLPILMNHSYFGVTLHYMVKELDKGKIINIIKKKIPSDMTHSKLRKETQNLCLKMLSFTAEIISHTDNVQSLRSVFDGMVKNNDLIWGNNYISKKHLSETLDSLKAKSPEHPVFK